MAAMAKSKYSLPSSGHAMKKEELKLKSYFCPHCQGFLMKGDVKKLSMTCPNCQKMIDSEEKDLLENKDENEK